jgi:hypothetical protein
VHPAYVRNARQYVPLCVCSSHRPQERWAEPSQPQDVINASSMVCSSTPCTVCAHHLLAVLTDFDFAIAGRAGAVDTLHIGIQGALGTELFGMAHRDIPPSKQLL